jgi:hypothetical protein
MLLLHRIGIGAVVMAALLVGITTALPADITQRERSKAATESKLYAAPIIDSTVVPGQFIAQVPAMTGAILIEEQDFVRQTNRFATLTPDGKTETAFTTPKNWPDTATGPSSVERSPDGKRAAMTGTDNRPRKGDATDPPQFPMFLASFPDSKELNQIDGNLELICWSPDGGTLVVRELPPDFDTNPGGIGTFLAIDLKTAKRTPIKVPEGHWLHDRSPDGSLFLTSGKDPAGALKGKRLFLINREGKVVRALTDETMTAGRAFFGPDGKWVLLSASPRSSKAVTGTWAWKLYRTTVETPKPELLMNIPDSVAVGGFHLSPDGKWVAFNLTPRVRVDLNPEKALDPDAETDEVEFAIVVVGLDGKNPRKIRSVKTKKPFSVSLEVIDWR